MSEIWPSPQTYYETEVPHTIWGRVDDETVHQYAIEQQPGFETYFVPLGDGRRMAVEVGGPEGGRPVILHHGSPGSRVNLFITARDLIRLDLRLYKYDRQGYGFSDPYPQLFRRPVDAVQDIRTMMNYFDLRRVDMIAQSGGTPYAMACAALWPEMVRHLALLVPVAPHEHLGDAWFDGISDFNRELFEAAFDTPPNVSFVTQRLGALAVATRTQQSGVLDALGAHGPNGKDLLHKQAAAAAHAAGMRPGPAGWVADVLGNREWGFTVSDISKRSGLTQGPAITKIWHATKDFFTPSSQTDYLIEQIDDVETVALYEGTHFSAAPEVHSALKLCTQDD